MTVWAVVPVKPLQMGKSRLAQVLTAEARLALNRFLLINTLSKLRSIPELEQVLVVSRDPQVLAIARELGAHTVLENGASHLNFALEKAMIVLRQHTTIGALIVPADLPLLNAEDVRKFLSFAKDPPVVGIVPDRHSEGTNALLVYPVGLIPYSFGQGSFQHHCELARQAGARLEIVELESMAVDIDLPEDLLLARDALDYGAFQTIPNTKPGG
jgi:2-phospho-L-lactate guanylyltransferase